MQHTWKGQQGAIPWAGPGDASVWAAVTYKDKIKDLFALLFTENSNEPLRVHPADFKNLQCAKK